MDEKVDQVVTKNIELSKIVVQGKGQIGKEANGLPIGVFDKKADTVPR